MAAGSYVAYIEARANSGGVLGGLQSDPVVIDGVTQTSIDWSWDAVNGASSYRLWVSADNGATWTYFEGVTSPYTQTTTAGTSGTLPDQNTTGETVLASGFSGTSISANANGVSIVGLQLSPNPYSAAGNPLPTASAALLGAQAVVSDATLPTYMGVYTSGGTIYAAVICSTLDGGSTYGWYTH